MFTNPLSDRTLKQRAHRRFRILTGLIAVLAGVTLLLQYTSHALLPAHRTDALWGVLVGVVGMGLVIDRRWAASARDDRAA